MTMRDGRHQHGRVRPRAARRAALGALGALAATVGAAVLVTGPALASGAPAHPAAAPAHLRAHAVASPYIVPSPTPAYAGDSGDPDVVYSGGVYYDFSTGTPLGNHIQALVNTSGNAESGYGSYTGHAYGSTALANPPAWEQVNTQTSPGVFFWNNEWIMYYDAAPAGFASDTGHDCLSIATTPSLSATNANFTDNSAGPWWCGVPGQGGVIDPSPFIDPQTGAAYLVWKSNDGGSAAAAEIWSAQLNATGTGFVTVPSELLYNNTVSYPWESTVENPDMIETGGTYILLFSGGIWDSASYGQGYAVCSGPLGPCTQPLAGPFLSSYDGVSGPGGGSFFQGADGLWYLGYQGWTTPAGCYAYACGGQRYLFVAPVSFGSQLNKPIVGMARTADGQGYWLVASDGGIFSYGDARFYGSTGNIALNKPIVGMARTNDGNGYWLVASDGGIFSYGDAAFYGSTGAMHLNQPIVGMAPTSDGLGYWLVASDGGIFSFGDAHFYGSTGSMHLNQPIVGMTTTTDGLGYWLVASDGGIFSFGDAAFWGSTGSIHLNQPIVGMAHTGSGFGYWLVAADGGVFSFGSTQFFGSVGGQSLATEVVGMATTADNGGYWMVAADGSVFPFGDAGFFGSPE